MAASRGVVIRTLFIVLIFVMVAAFAYVIAIRGLTSCFNLRARWAIALLANVSIYVVVIGAWFVYKESSWIKTIVFVVLMLTIGSVATCGSYILMQFFKLSPEELCKDPLYFVLLRHKKKSDYIMDVAGHIKGLSVVTARVIFYALGFLMLGALIYTIIVDFSPSHYQAFAPCLLTYLTDIYIHDVILSVWIAYKEPSWKSAFLWILSLVCLGNIITCVYILRELSYLSPQRSVSLIIFNRKTRVLMQSSDPLLMDGA